MSRALLALLMLGASAAAEEPCPPLPTAQLPPVAARPSSAKSLKDSQRAARSIAEEATASSGRFADAASCTPALLDWQEERRIVLYDALVRREPADFATRVDLLQVMKDAVYARLDATAHDDADGCISPACKAIRARLIEEYERLRDQAWSGCKPCAQWIAGFDAYHANVALSYGADVNRFVESLVHGPPGEPGDATRAVVAALDLEWEGQGAKDIERDAARNAARYVDASTVTRVDDEFYSSGADEATLSHGRGMRVRGWKGLRKWLDKLEGTGLPGSGLVMSCDARCCHWPFEDHHPHHFQIVDMCFDARMHLTLLRTEMGGM